MYHLLRQIKSTLRSKIRGEYSTEVLIHRGLIVGSDFHRERECIIDESHSWLITIGNHVTLAPRVHILAHDSSTKQLLGYTKIGAVTIGNNVFIGANTIILPNVTIGDNVIIGAGSVVSKDIPSKSVAAGNPAQVIGTIDDYVSKNKALMSTRPVYNAKWTERQAVSTEKKEVMRKALKDGIGYVE